MAKELINCLVSLSTHPLFQSSQKNQNIPDVLSLQDSLLVYNKILKTELKDLASHLPTDEIICLLMSSVQLYQTGEYELSNDRFNHLMMLLTSSYPLNLEPKLFLESSLSTINYRLNQFNNAFYLHDHITPYFSTHSEFNPQLLNLLVWFPIKIASSYDFHILSLEDRVPIISELLKEWLKETGNSSYLERFNEQIMLFHPIKLALKF